MDKENQRRQLELIKRRSDEFIARIDEALAEDERFIGECRAMLKGADGMRRFYGRREKSPLN